MQVIEHRKTDTSLALTISVPFESEEQLTALVGVSELRGGGIVVEDVEAHLSFLDPFPVHPVTGRPLMSEKDYAEMQVREAGLLIQSALDSASQGKGKKLASEGTTIEV